MKLNRDIKSVRILKIKGLLFLLLGMVAASFLVLESPTIQTLALLAVAIWAFCRFYYFLFYVLEHYAGEGKYAGVWDAFRTTFHSKTQNQKAE